MAKADMVAFNRTQREDEDQSIAESAARHIEYMQEEAVCTAPDPSYRLVEDDDEIRACTRSIVTGV